MRARTSPHRVPIRTTLLRAALLVLAASTALGSGCRVRTTETAAPVTVAAPQSPADPPVPLPNAKGSLKFVVLGDFGTGGKPEYELAARMASLHEQFEFDTVLLVGDNLYGGERPQDFVNKFETPFKPLLDAGVKFMGALGQHRQTTGITAKGFDTDLAFMAAEISGGTMTFNAISRDGTIVDSGIIVRRKVEPAA